MSKQILETPSPTISWICLVSSEVVSEADISGVKQGSAGETVGYTSRLCLGMEFPPFNCNEPCSSPDAIDTWEGGV